MAREDGNKGASIVLRLAEIRQLFLDFFHDRGHQIIPSSSLVPGEDPSLLFTNAGMVQFKDIFLGHRQAPKARAVSVQRCVRAGGKHNDLDNVGYTARHHTFFEMLGNFSFGDYFKRDAIEFAWSFLTEQLQIDPEKLWVTVHHTDDEAAAIWLNEIKIDTSRFVRCGDEDNFWAMGDTGPCGPCSEIFYDHGAEVAGGPPGSDEADGDRYMEIWNLVFMQYNREAHGELSALPHPSVDTGMGLERLATVMQGVHDNYKIDLFKNLLLAAARILACTDKDNSSLRVVVDHIRSTSFLILDGILPSNEGRGYVLRRIIRRACRHGYHLGVKTPFFSQLVPALVAEMGHAYPMLTQAQDLIQSVIKEEEEQFARTLHQGMRVFEQAVADLTPGAKISGDVIFRLYDTYGFPYDLTADIAREKQLQLDSHGFEEAMQQQRQLSQRASRFSGPLQFVNVERPSVFVGYAESVSQTNILLLLQDGEVVDKLELGEEGAVVLSTTPFYAEAGGQLGDRGSIKTETAMFEVWDTQHRGDAILHFGKVQAGYLSTNEQVIAEIDSDRRCATALNHSATHLLHAALQEVLGGHVQQKGSLVSSDKLRFDFSHAEALSQQQLDMIELRVNREIRRNCQVVVQTMDYETAVNSGAQALFGEKYADEVRVIGMGDFSSELCGGTHVSATGDIGVLKIIMETGVAAGIRRIEAVTGRLALMAWQASEAELSKLSLLLKTDKAHLPDKLEQLLDQQKKLEKQITALNTQLALTAVETLVSRAKTIKNVQFLASEVQQVDSRGLRELVDKLRDRLGPCVVLLALVENGKIKLVAGVNQVTARVSANELMRYVSGLLGGKGGGRVDLAQGAGSDVDALNDVLEQVATWVHHQLE